MQFRLIQCIALLIMPFFLQGQADSILALPEEQQANALWNWFNANQAKDSATVMKQIHDLDSVFTRHKAKELQRDTWLMPYLVLINWHHRWESKGMDLCNEALQTAIDNGWEIQEVNLLMQKGTLLYERGKYPAALEHVILGYKRMNEIGYDNFAIAYQSLLNIGLLFYKLGDYQNSSVYIHEALAMDDAKLDNAFQVHGNNTLGLCYLHMSQYDSAIHYLTLAHAAAVIQKDSFWMTLSNGNKGHALFKNGEFEKAIPLMKEDFTKSNSLKEYDSATNAALSLASAYLQKNEMDQADYYMDYARRHVRRTDPMSLSFFYRTLYDYTKAKGDYIHAAQYVDSFLIFRKKVDSIHDQTIIDKAKLKVEVDQHARELQLLEQTRSRQVLIRNGMLAILVLTGIIASLWISRQQLKRKKQLELAEVRQKLSDEQLRLAHTALQAYTNTIKEKNELIHAFNDEVEMLRQSGIQQLDERSSNLTELMRASILTEDDWKHFRDLFDLVHPGFFIRLKEKMADLTPAETRLLALTKLQLAPREMASMLGISYESIKKSRQRLRKKVNLHEEGSLDELVEII